MAGGRSVGAHFLEALLRLLLLDDTPLDHAELAGDALLPLTLLEGQAFQGVCVKYLDWACGPLQCCLTQTLLTLHRKLSLQRMLSCCHIYLLLHMSNTAD
jgi:hypothetical protein